MWQCLDEHREIIELRRHDVKLIFYS